MSVESIVSALGLSELLARDYVAVQLVIFAATACLFAMSLAFMIYAARSAGGARAARSEAESILRHAQDVVVEARQLSAKIERASERSPSSASAKQSQSFRVSARETTPEADVEIVSRNLDAAKESASVPKGLIRGRR